MSPCLTLTIVYKTVRTASHHLVLTEDNMQNILLASLIVLSLMDWASADGSVLIVNIYKVVFR